MVWGFAIVWVISFVAAFAMMPKPQSAPAPGLSEFTAPTAEEGREIPVLFGTRVMEAPNIVWWGDLQTVAVRKKGGKK
jgi:hypothetical protein